VVFSVGCLCHVSEVYICRRMRGVAGIRVAKGLDKSFPQIGENRLSGQELCSDYKLRKEGRASASSS
jgi:hypothetical protein